MNEEIKIIDCEKIARLIRDGNKGGTLDDETGKRIAWKLLVKVFNQ